MLIKKEDIYKKFGVDVDKLYAKCAGISLVGIISDYDKTLKIERGMLCLRIKSVKLVNPKFLRLPNFHCAKFIQVKSDEFTEEEYISYYFKEMSQIEKETAETIL